MRQEQQRGFTLIELVVAMSIAALLAAIAIPAYSSYTLRSHRTEAKTVLADLAAMEERFYSTSNTYTTDPGQLGYGAVGGAFPITVGSGYYQVTQPTFTAATATAPAYYKFTATAVGNQTKDTTCASFSLDSQSAQTASPDTTPPSCWQR